ncbi:PilZ domain-containing protein [Pseudothauera nasutitermitis]|uniref:PilZ domain-containing protein n=1 Tax=Pseudothauera nasutitermitis TaxID=2565930 RepID=A0A4S4AVN6_9RHOO|nr:PilZ domain-containing protein [Pseudothauera nasutitermitis]THF64066.1 PilZ domain-containing protein [Pseudothauera nasutitermitis]
MNDRSAPPERRLDRRIPLGCAAAIHLPGSVTVEAECIELSISGMTLHSTYVPGESETIEVSVSSPNGAAPLHARLEVKRCHALGGGRYEIGGAIVQVLG